MANGKHDIWSLFLALLIVLPSVWLLRVSLLVGFAYLFVVGLVIYFVIRWDDRRHRRRYRYGKRR